MKTILLLCGLYNVGLAIFHVTFWKTFHWNTNLKKLSFANKAILQMLNVQIIYYFAFVALVCFFFPEELLVTKLGHFFLAGNALFWLIRTVQQFIFLRVNNSKVHLLTIVFLIGVLLFALPLFL